MTTPPPPVNPQPLTDVQRQRQAILAKPVLSDEDLDFLAQPTPEDIAATVEWWHANAPKKYKGLIDAKDVDQT